VADTKISGLSAGAPAQAGDLIPIARSGSNFSITPANILAYGASPVAGTTAAFSSTLAAGNTTITGTLSTSGADTAASYSATGGSAPSVAASKVYSFVSGGVPVKQWVDAGNAANARIADFVFASGSFSGRFTNDANSAATNWLSVAGNSSAITSIALTGNTAVTGTLSATSIGANAQILMYPGSSNMTVGTGSVANTEKFMVASPGNAFGGIGITDTVDASNFPFVVFRKTDGTGIGSISRVTTTNAVVYNTTSDYRLKNNQAPLTGSGEFIDALKPKTWEWAENGIKAAGFVAHEFAEVSPSSVTGEKDGSREEEYEVSPAVAATTDEDGKELTPAIAAVKATRTVPVYQGMQASSSEVIANLVAELQSLRKRISQLEAK